LQRSEHFPWPTAAESNETVSAHEFHYSGLDSNVDANVKYAYSMKRGSGIDGKHDGYIYKNLLANYAHLRDTSKHHWVKEFVDFIRQKKS